MLYIVGIRAVYQCCNDICYFDKSLVPQMEGGARAAGKIQASTAYQVQVVKDFWRLGVSYDDDFGH